MYYNVRDLGKNLCMNTEKRAEIEIHECDEPQYHRLFGFGVWRVAVLNHGPKFAAENLCRMERHLKTDEAFILLEGEATLLAGDGTRRVPMETGKVYNFPVGAWHQIVTQPGAKVLIVENDDTGLDNTEYRDLPKDNQ